MLSIKKDDALFVVQRLTRSQEKSWNRLTAFIIRAASIKYKQLYKVNNFLCYKTIIWHMEKVSLNSFQKKVKRESVLK